MKTDDPHLHDAPPPSRRRRAFVTASVAAAVLLAGGGAYWAQAALSGGPTDGGTGSGRDGTPPPLVLDGFQDGDATEGGTTAPTGEETYRIAKGVALPDGPERASVHREGGRVGSAEVARLAESLGVDAEPVLRQSTWLVVEGKDGAGPALRAAQEPPGRWSFVRYQAPAGHDCTPPAATTGPEKPPRCPALVPGGGPDTSVSSENGSGPSSEQPSSDASPVDPGIPSSEPTVSEREAERAAKPVLKALELDDAEVDASTTSGALRTVEAAPVVDGLPTEGRETQVTVGSGGKVVRAQGLLAPVKEGAGYPVLDAERTLAALNGRGRDARTDIQCVRVPCEPADGGQRIPVTGAEFVLAVHAEGGDQVLVPSWRFALGGEPAGRTVTHPAVEPRFLAPPSGSDPSTGPAEPRPSDGGESPNGGDTPVAPPAPPSDLPGELPAPGQRIEAYEAADRTVTLHFWGDVCSSYTAHAEESADTVRVTVTAGREKPGQVCIQIARETAVEVSLEKPVGDRTVVDSDGRELPER